MENIIETEKTALIDSIDSRKEITDTICAMLNSSLSGTIYIGVDKDGNPVKTRMENETVLTLLNHIRKLVRPRPVLKHTIHKTDTYPVLQIEFYGQSRPYYSNDICLKRTNTENIEINPDEITHSDYTSSFDADIDFTEFKSNLKVIRYKDYFTPLKTQKFTDTIPNLITKSLKFKDKDTPLEAFKEIITNAFEHNDYTIDNEITIHIYPRRTDITNKGSFPSQMTPFDFMDYKYTSFIRNPKLHELLKTENDFTTVAKLCLDNHIAYSFQIEENEFTFIFYTKESSFYLEEKNFLKLSRIECLLYAELRDHPLQNKMKLASKFCTCDKTIQRHVTKMMKLGLVKRVGSNKTGHWEIT